MVFDYGVFWFVVGIGLSVLMDGGIGMFMVLGVCFLDVVGVFVFCGV